MRFRHFAAVDWSGAVGERQRGLAVALCGTGQDAPTLVRPGHLWSRGEVLAWLLDLSPATLVGLDLGTSLPFVDRRAFFPGWDRSPAGARALWALVEEIAAQDLHLSATGFVDHPHAARHFRRHGGRAGDLFEPGRGRLRETERAQQRQGLSPVSNFNLIGAAQVGKSSLTGMRVLHRLGGQLPVWPFDAVPDHGSVLVEIYTSLAARAAGVPKGRTKLRTVEELNEALATLGSAALAGTGPIGDHAADALLTAAWLRTASDDPGLWHPAGLTDEVRRTEGWTFGVG